MRKIFGGLFKIGLVLLVAGGGYAAWRWYDQRPKEPAVDYKTATLSRGDLTQSVTANGQLSPVKSVTVGSQVSGIIVAIKVDFNSRVTNGQVITQIDPSTYQHYVTQAEAELANARAALELADLNCRRATQLRTNELITQADYEKAIVDLHQAEAVIKMREAALKKAQVDLERTTIYAPIDGIVISRAVDVGQTVAASFNTPTLFNIANDLRHMRIEAMVSEADVGGVLEGQRATFTVDAFPNRQFEGEVTQVRYAPITNQNVVNYVTIVEVNNDDLKLRPGMTANVSIIVAQRTNVVRLPNAALRFRPPENAVVKGATNAPPREAGGRPQELAAAGPNPPPSMGGGDEASREERRRRFASLPPEEQERIRNLRRARGGDGAGGGFGAGRRGNGGESVIRTVYMMEKETVAGKEQTTLKAVKVKTGITDGAVTEVLEGLKEGDVVVSGVNQPAGAATAMRPGGSPFGSPFGFRPR